MGLVDILVFLLQKAPSLLEAVDTRCGKHIAYAMESPHAVQMVTKLLELGADRISPCTPSMYAGGSLSCGDTDIPTY